MASSPFLTTSSTSVLWRTVSSGLTWSVMSEYRKLSSTLYLNYRHSSRNPCSPSISTRIWLRNSYFSISNIFWPKYFLFVQKEIIETLYEVIESEFNCIARKLGIIIKCWRVSTYAHWISAIIEFSAWRLRFLWWDINDPFLKEKIQCSMKIFAGTESNRKYFKDSVNPTCNQGDVLI